MDTTIMMALMKKMANGFGTVNDHVQLITSGHGVAVAGLDLNTPETPLVSHIVLWSKDIGRVEISVQHDNPEIDIEQVLKTKPFWGKANLYKGGNDEVADVVLQPTVKLDNTVVAYMHVLVIPKDALVIARKNSGEII